MRWNVGRGESEPTAALVSLQPRGSAGKEREGRRRIWLEAGVGIVIARGRRR